MKIKIDQIKIGNRYRKVIGDLNKLKDSIVKQGLLQPIGITSNNELVFGARRIEAYKELGYTEIEANIVKVTSIIEGEHDENELRQEFRRSERTAIADKVTEIIGERRGGDRKSSVTQVPFDKNKGEVTEIIGERRGQPEKVLAPQGANTFNKGKKSKAPQGTFDPNKGKKTSTIAAKKAGFKSEQEYRRVSKVVKEGTQELIDAMDDEIIDVTSAAKLAIKPKEEQKKILDKIKTGEAKTVKDAIVLNKKEVIKQKEITVEEENKNTNKFIDIHNTNHKFEIIYADPCWQYWDGGQKNQSLHYSTMPLKEICDLPVKNIADENCILFMWVTYPILDKAFEVIKSWGFNYSTAGFVWVKKNKKQDTPFFGCGSWTRANSELCLIATKGIVSRIDASISQIIQAPIQEHSQKPEEVKDKITQLIGKLKRIELFSRSDKDDGWYNWGNKI